MMAGDPLGVLPPLPSPLPPPRPRAALLVLPMATGHSPGWGHRAFRSRWRGDENSGLPAPVRLAVLRAGSTRRTSSRPPQDAREEGEPGLPRPPRAGPRRSTPGETQPRGRRHKRRLRSPTAAAAAAHLGSRFSGSGFSSAQRKHKFRLPSQEEASDAGF